MIFRPVMAAVCASAPARPRPSPCARGHNASIICVRNTLEGSQELRTTNQTLASPFLPLVQSNQPQRGGGKIVLPHFLRFFLICLTVNNVPGVGLFEFLMVIFLLKHHAAGEAVPLRGCLFVKYGVATQTFFFEEAYRGICCPSRRVRVILFHGSPPIE